MQRPTIVFLLLLIACIVAGRQLQKVYLSNIPQSKSASVSSSQKTATTPLSATEIPSSNPKNQPSSSRPESGPVPLPGMSTGASEDGKTDSESLQINILQSQIEYLEQQNQILQEENSKLLDQLAALRGNRAGSGQMSLPSSSVSSCDPGPDNTKNGSGMAPDFVGIGIELLRIRGIKDIPIPTVEVEPAEVEKRIANWLSTQFASDHGLKQGRALAALGAIPRAVDTIALKAAFLTYQIGGWYDASDSTIYLAKGVTAPHLAKENAMALSYSYLFKQKGVHLFPKSDQPITLDARLSREAIIAGDATHLRFLHSIQNPEKGGGGGVGEDPDDPSRSVPIPNFLRELELLPFSLGFDFMQAMYSIGQWEQIDATYHRPPIATPELMESQVYLQETQFSLLPIEWPDVSVQNIQPFWNDTLGPLGTVLYLKQFIPEAVAADCAQGWLNDRLMSYENKEQGRDHVVWQTLWQNSDAADAFFSAMRTYLTNRSKVEPNANSSEKGLLELKHQDRFLRLKRTHSGTGVIYIESSNQNFVDEALKKFAGF